MNFFDFFRKKHPATKETERPISIDLGSPKSPVQQIKEQTGIDLGLEYARLSTSGDERVCPMCAQFEGKVFLSTDAPELPLCPVCSCAYEYYLKEDLPSDTIISNKNDFVLPAKCTALFYKHQQELYTTTDIDKQIRLCEADLKRLPEFMAPYLSAGFPAPEELACRDMLPDLYMQLGKWDKAEKTINKCINSKAYFPDDGSEQLKALASYKKVATETMDYISQNPGCLQHNIYKKMGFEGEEKEMLKDFMKKNKLLTKEKYNNTYKLFYNSDK
ncbi:MAG: phage head morphogenesis protein [Lachnospiraceae bacterium]|nr:phage head morphogenesis protein [Lachnospiraceae bacterium]